MPFAKYIRNIPDYPKKGVMFRDITTLLSNAQGFRKAVDALVQNHMVEQVDLVAGIEARGFILGGAVAHQLGKGFVPIRKRGKLPWETISEEYELEYGIDAVEIHTDSILKDDRVLLIDDLIATGGTARAAAKLIERSGGHIVAASFVIDLPDLGGSKVLKDLGISVTSLMEFAGD